MCFVLHSKTRCLRWILTENSDNAFGVDRQFWAIQHNMCRLQNGDTKKLFSKCSVLFSWHTGFADVKYATQAWSSRSFTQVLYFYRFSCTVLMILLAERHQCFRRPPGTPFSRRPRDFEKSHIQYNTRFITSAARCWHCSSIVVDLFCCLIPFPRYYRDHTTRYRKFLSPLPR